MIMELADETPHAYVPFLPAVKSSQPHDNVFSDCKDKYFLPFHQGNWLKSCKKKINKLENHVFPIK